MNTNPWVVLGVLALSRLVLGLQFQSVGAVAPDLMARLNLDYTEFGTLIGAYAMPGMAMALAAGWLIVRLGDRRVLLAGLELMTVGGLLLAVAPGFVMALAGRLIAGAGSVLLVVVVPNLAMDRFAGASLAAAMGTLMSAYPLGIGIGFLALPLAGGWRWAMAAVSMACLASLAAAAAGVRQSEAAPNPAPTASGRPQGTLAPLVAIGVAWALINASYAVLLGFAPAFFVHTGLDERTAGLLGCVAACATVPIGPVSGWIVGRLRRAMLANMVCIGSMAVSLALLPTTAAPVTIMLIMGALIGVCAGPLISLAGEGVPPKHRAFGMGLFFTIYFAGMTVLPPLAGLARDLTGTLAAPFYAASGFCLLGLVALLARTAVPCRSMRPTSTLAAGPP